MRTNIGRMFTLESGDHLKITAEITSNYYRYEEIKYTVEVYLCVKGSRQWVLQDDKSAYATEIMLATYELYSTLEPPATLWS